jgi:hypothetical protein
VKKGAEGVTERVGGVIEIVEGGWVRKGVTEIILAQILSNRKIGCVLWKPTLRRR